MERLTKEQWLKHGLKTLAQAGFTELKADKLCKSLGVSRGSFYWHFKNLADFHSAVLAYWQQVAVASTIESIENQSDDPLQKLRLLIGVAKAGDRSLEQAIRAWAFSDSMVKQTVQQIDQQAEGYVAQLLIQSGLDGSTAALRADIFYSSYIGRLMLGKANTEPEASLLVDQLMMFLEDGV